MMWQLHMTNAAKVPVGSFDRVTAAARRIIEIEAYPVTDLFLEMHVTTWGTDEEAFGHLERTGKRALYVIKRRVN